MINFTRYVGESLFLRGEGRGSDREEDGESVHVSTADTFPTLGDSA